MTSKLKTPVFILALHNPFSQRSVCVCVCVRRGGGEGGCWYMKTVFKFGLVGAKKLCVDLIFPGGLGVAFQLQSMGEPGFLLEQP